MGLFDFALKKKEEEKKQPLGSSFGGGWGLSDLVNEQKKKELSPSVTSNIGAGAGVKAEGGIGIFDFALKVDPESIKQKEQALVKVEETFSTLDKSIETNYKRYQELGTQLDDLQAQIQEAPEELQWNLSLKYENLLNEHNKLVDQLQTDTQQQKKVYADYNTIRDSYEKDMEIYNKKVEAQNKQAQQQHQDYLDTSRLGGSMARGEELPKTREQELKDKFTTPPEKATVGGMVGISEPLDISTLPDPVKKVVQAIGGTQGFRITEPELYKQSMEIKNEIYKYADPLERIAKAHEMMTGEPMEEALKELQEYEPPKPEQEFKPTWLKWRGDDPAVYGKSAFGLVQLSPKKLPEKYEGALGLVSQASQFTTTEQVGNFLQTASRNVLIGNMAINAAKVTFKTVPEIWEKIKNKDVIKHYSRDEILKIWDKVDRGIANQTEQSLVKKIAEEDSVINAIKQGFNVKQTVPRFATPGGVTLYSGIPADQIAKSIIETGKVTADVVKGIDPVQMAQVTQLLLNNAPILAGEFLKAVEKSGGVSVPQAQQTTETPLPTDRPDIPVSQPEATQAPRQDTRFPDMTIPQQQEIEAKVDEMIAQEIPNIQAKFPEMTIPQIKEQIIPKVEEEVKKIVPKAEGKFPEITPPQQEILAKVEQVVKEELPKVKYEAKAYGGKVPEKPISEGEKGDLGNKTVYELEPSKLAWEFDDYLKKYKNRKINSLNLEETKEAIGWAYGWFYSSSPVISNAGNRLVEQLYQHKEKLESTVEKPKEIAKGKAVYDPQEKELIMPNELDKRLKGMPTNIAEPDQFTHDAIYGKRKGASLDDYLDSEKVKGNFPVKFDIEKGKVTVRLDEDNYLVVNRDLTEEQRFNDIYEGVEAIKEKLPVDTKLSIPELKYEGTIKEFTEPTPTTSQSSEAPEKSIAPAPKPVEAETQPDWFKPDKGTVAEVGKVPEQKLATPEQVQEVTTLGKDRKLIIKTDQGNISDSRFKRLAKAMTGKTDPAKMTPDEIDEFKYSIEQVVQRQPWEPPIIPVSTKIVPKDFFEDLHYKEPNLFKYVTPKEHLLRSMGVEDLVKDITEAKKEAYLKGIDANNFIDNTIKEINRKAPKFEKIKKKVFNQPTERVANFRDLLDRYETAPDYLNDKDKEIFNKLRKFTNEMLSDVNVVRERLGLDPIKKLNAYVPHFLDELAKQIVQKKYPFPEDVKYWLGRNMPKKIYNPTEMERRVSKELTDVFSKDLGKLLKVMSRYDLRDIYLSQPYSILRAKLNALGDKMPASVRKEIDDYIRYDIFEYPDELDNLFNNLVKTPTELINFFLRPFGRIITNPAKAVSGIMRRGLMGGAIAARPKLIIRNLFQRLLLMDLYQPKYFLKAQLMPTPKRIKDLIDNSKFWKLSTKQGFEDIPKEGFSIEEKALAPYGWSHKSNVSVSMKTGAYFAEEMVKLSENPNSRFYKYAEKFAKEKGVSLDKLLWNKDDILLEAEDAGAYAQWLYYATGMPQIYRGQIKRLAFSLQSWSLNYFFKHVPEMITRTFTGRTSRGKLLRPIDRLNAIKGLAIIAGITYGLKELGDYAYDKYLLPWGIALNANIVSPAGQVFGGIINYVTAYNDWERVKAEKQIKDAWKLFIPGSLAYKDFTDWLNGNKSLDESLFYKDYRRINEKELNKTTKTKRTGSKTTTTKKKRATK